MNISGLHFAAFWPLFLLLGIPFIAFVYFLRVKALKKAHQTLGIKEGSINELFYRAFYYSLAWFFLVIALMNPFGNPHYASDAIQSESLETVFLIDTSASMSALDADASNSRLTSALQKADELAVSFSGQRVGITTFTSIAATLLPPSFDLTSFKITLREIAIDDTGIPGTDLLHVFEGLSKEAPRHYIMISDGEDTLWQVSEDKDARQKALESALMKIPGKWTFIGVGGEKPVSIPGMNVKTAQAKKLLYALSSAVNGEYIDSSKQKVQVASSALQRSTVTYSSYFQIPLLLALVFLLLGKWERARA